VMQLEQLFGKMLAKELEIAIRGTHVQSPNASQFAIRGMCDQLARKSDSAATMNAALSALLDQTSELGLVLLEGATSEAEPPVASPKMYGLDSGALDIVAQPARPFRPPRLANARRSQPQDLVALDGLPGGRQSEIWSGAAVTASATNTPKAPPRTSEPCDGDEQHESILAEWLENVISNSENSAVGCLCSSGGANTSLHEDLAMRSTEPLQGVVDSRITEMEWQSLVEIRATGVTALDDIELAAQIGESQRSTEDAMIDDEQEEQNSEYILTEWKSLAMVTSEP